MRRTAAEEGHDGFLEGSWKVPRKYSMSTGYVVEAKRFAEGSRTLQNMEKVEDALS